MAGDTRDTAPSQVPPQGTSSPKYDTFNTPPESANALPYGSGLNTAGSRKEAPSLTQAIKTVRIEDFKQVYMYPCARESLLMGIGGGFGMGGIRALLGAAIPKAANWAVGTFVFASWANYEYCMYKRTLERAHMKRAVEIIDRKKAEKEAEAKRKREERRRAKEDLDKAEEDKMKRASGSSWRFW